MSLSFLIRERKELGCPNPVTRSRTMRPKGK